MNDNIRSEERLFEALGEVSEKYIAEAAAPVRRRTHRWIYTAAGIAAAAVICLGIAGASGVPFISKNHGTKLSDNLVKHFNKDYLNTFRRPENSGELPMLTREMEFGAMGFEGYGTKDISKILTDRIWSDDWELTELPVFMTSDEINILTADEIEQRLSAIAERIGEKFVPVIFTDGKSLSDEEIAAIKEKVEAVGEVFNIEDYFTAGKLYGQAGNIGLTMNERGEFFIDIPLSEIDAMYRPAGELYEMSYDDAQLLGEYLADKYYDLLGMYNPVAELFQDCSFSGENSMTMLSLYDAGYVADEECDPVTAIINKNFNSLYARTDDGMLHLSCLDCVYADCPSYMYPVISKEEADEKMRSGDYVTTVWTEYYLPDGMSEEDITFDGIVYKRTADYKYHMPYYKYVVELHPEQKNFPEGFGEYGAFYVPAVRPEYLSGVNTDTAFN